MRKLYHLLTGATVLVGLYSYPSFAQSTPAPGDIVFTHACSGGGDICEFLTLKRLDLSGLALTDRSLCASGKFFDNSGSEGVTSAGFFSTLTDVPAGTYVRVSKTNGGTNETATNDGVVTFYGSNLNIASNGDQFILYTGTPTVVVGTSSCPGTYTHVFAAGINVANTDWITTGNPTSTTSYAPGTSSDYDTGNFDNNQINPGTFLPGNAAAIRTACTTSGNWQGADGGSTYTSFTLKNIQFNKSNYSTGTASYSTTPTSATINLSSLAFSGADANTRYLVLMRANATSDLPADRFTSYSGINTDFTLAPNVVTTFTPTDLAPGSAPVAGNGKMVYFGYGLPSSLTLTGLNTTTTAYYLSVWAVNGNGYSANLSSTFYTLSIGTALPVTWLSFRAALEGDDVHLTWSTASESNNEGFDIQRSADGKDWETIGFVPGAETTSEVKSYDYTDSSPFTLHSSLTYYRLAQRDFDGTTDYSPVRVIELTGAQGGIRVYPNPANELVTVAFSEQTDVRGMVQLFDQNGRKVGEYSVPPGTVDYQVRVAQLPSGTYLLKVKVGTKEWMKRLVVE
ncbi:MAG: T9SS type A sorting domain-containing protein [Lewinellaceae bacterium]|nr:T9SS type A sorting domain-containing protein [Lewinellaceae bacterium]